MPSRNWRLTLIVTLVSVIGMVVGVSTGDKTKPDEMTDLDYNKFAGGSNPISAVTQGQEQYRTNYYFSGQPHPAPVSHFRQGDWNRDSYSNAAADLGYSGDASQSYAATAYHPVAPSTSYGVDEGYGGGYDDGGSGIGGLGGLAGLLGLKGLKGLGILGLLKLGIIPLLFLALPALLLLPLLLLFIPIPVITVPQGRSFGIEMKELGGKMSSLARSVLDNEQCIERLSCEMSRYGRGSYIDKTLKRMIKKFEPQMPSPLQRMARAYLESSTPGCKKYTCFLMDDSGGTSSSSTVKKYKKNS